MRKKSVKKFFDPVRLVPLPEVYLRDYLSQTEEDLRSKSADTLLKEAEEVFKKIKLVQNGFPDFSAERLEEAALKALGALKIAAKKYEAENKSLEASCVYQLIASQASRCVSSSYVYQAPRFL